MARKTIKAVSIGSYERSKINDNFTELYAADALLSSGKATSAAMTAGSGFPGTGTIYKAAVSKVGDIYVTQIMLDLTGVASVAVDLDIIGTHATDPAHIGQITTAVNGGILMGTMTCLEAPVGGAIDIDLYSATEGVGKKDDAIATLYTETALVTAGGNWTLALTKALGNVPANSEYLYLTSGAATAGTYSAGKFLITLYGY